jgi:hypothetical protein
MKSIAQPGSAFWLLCLQMQHTTLAPIPAAQKIDATVDA